MTRTSNLPTPTARRIGRPAAPTRHRLMRVYRQLRGLKTSIANPFFEELRVRWPAAPTIEAPASQLCTSGQFGEPGYDRICALLQEPPRLHRKQWELVYIYRSIEQAGLIGPGRRGVVFGVGREKLPSLFVAQGCHILATDQPAGKADRHWSAVDQHADSLEKIFAPQIVERDHFYRDAAFRPVDMNAIPDDLADFDFCWSACALEHLGSLRHGLDFIRHSLECLKPGGLAVHTTEFNLGSANRTLERGKSVVYRERDLSQFADELRRQGYEITLNLHPGAEPIDLMIDRDRDSDIHLRLYIKYRVLSTSAGLQIRKSIMV
jgi:SAM-dependent methyltransferase